jgi:hypothetical protein
VKRGKPHPAPISSHRMFPAMVALWFAALLGIGSMILPATLFDMLAGQSGLGEAIPAAGGPLAANAKLIFTLLATGAGAALGLALARKVAAGQSPEPVRRREFATPAQPTPLERVSEPRKPISIHEDLAQPLEQEEADANSRRRSLAMEEPEGPSDWFHPNLPFSELPAGAVAIASAPQVQPEPEPETLDLACFPMNEMPEPEIFDLTPPEPAQEAWDAPSAPAAAFAMPVWPEDQEDAERLEQEITTPTSLDDEGEVELLGLSDLADRLERAIRTRVEQEAEQAQARAAMQAATEAPLRVDAAPFVADAPIAEDGGLQSFFAQPPAPQAPVASEEVGAENAPFAPARTSSIPKALRPVLQEDLEEIDEEPFSLPVARTPQDARQVFGSPLAFSQPDAVETDDIDDLAEENYGSLADIGTPFRAGTEFVRIEEPEPEDDSVEPAVIFPGQAERRSALLPDAEQPVAATTQGFGFRRKGEAVQPAFAPVAAMPAAAPAMAPASADPAETERALRLALATLQRMSGAA